LKFPPKAGKLIFYKYYGALHLGVYILMLVFYKCLGALHLDASILKRLIILTKKVHRTIIFVTITTDQHDNQGAAHRNILIKIDNISLPGEIL